MHCFHNFGADNWKIEFHFLHQCKLSYLIVELFVADQQMLTVNKHTNPFSSTTLGSKYSVEILSYDELARLDSNLNTPLVMGNEQCLHCERM